jgi:hypothetical protein
MLKEIPGCYRTRAWVDADALVIELEFENGTER